MEKILAQSLTVGNYNVEGPQGLTITSISTFIKNALPYVFAIAGIGLLFMILSAGFTLLTSAGDAKKTEEGKNRLTFAIVGFVVIFVAYWIVQILGIMFDVKEIQSIFGNSSFQFQNKH